MSKRELLESDDFKAFMSDIESDLEAASLNFNKLVIYPNDFTIEHDLKMAFARGQIQAYQTVVNKPATYLDPRCSRVERDASESKTSDHEKAMKMDADNRSRIFGIWRRCFGAAKVNQ